MKTEDKQKGQRKEDTVIHVSKTFSVLKKVDKLSEVVHPDELLTNISFLHLLFRDIEELDKTDMDNLTLHMRNAFKKSWPSATPSRSRIENYVSQYLTHDRFWHGRKYVYEQDGAIYIQKSKNEALAVSNFTLTPKHTIQVNGIGGQMYVVFDLHTEIGNKQLTYPLILTSDNFNTLDELQQQLKLQVPNSVANLNGCGPYMKDIFHKYVTLNPWDVAKEGTSLLGLERLKADGPKYFCTPESIYDERGQVSKDVLFMGNRQSNSDEIKNLGNLKYEEEEWRKTAYIFLKHILGLNDKTQMMYILGWMGAVPHDYVVRKENNRGFFPHCHIVGEPGAGKSTLMTLLKQFMGHNDAAPRAFTSSFELQKLLNTSYTIPAVIDEYGKRWKPDFTDTINKVLVESFNRGYYSKGTANQDSIYYKYKNPLLFGGQTPTSDQALATRIVPVRLKKSYHRSAEGKQSLHHLQILQELPDKNFWVGYNLWCAQFSNEEVKEQYTQFQKLAHSHIRESRVADIYAVVMLGLYYMKKLADELCVAIGYTSEDIDNLPFTVANSSILDDLEETNKLHVFLQETAQIASAYGNANAYYGKHFGVGLTVMEQQGNEGAGQFGKTHKSEACIYGKDLILIKVENMVKVINKGGRNDLDAREIQIFIDEEFSSSLREPSSEDNLVLAPKQYRTKYGPYTVFSKSKLIEDYPEFSNIIWL